MGQLSACVLIINVLRLNYWAVGINDLKYSCMKNKTKKNE